ncbi:MAG: C39 family peptidase [Candidatus Latescibacteria bacterium]|nr:C39 family peptidase [Candidatus Latescibacterota bacterium]
MSNALLLFAQGLDETALQRAVPPPIQPKQIEPLAWNGDTFSFDLSPAVLEGALEILPGLSVVHDGAWGYQFAIECETKTGHSCRAVLDPIGSFVGAEAGAANEEVAAEIDLLRIRAPLQTATLHLRVQGVAPTAPALLSVSVRRKGAVPAPTVASRDTALAVPPQSQMVLRPELASHVCSPTSVAMLLAYYGHSADIYDVIAEARHQPSGLYGVWPANIHAAARRGFLGYLLHFPSWDAARALLDAGFPIVASVRYEAGELSRAAIERTSGHLLVVRGCVGDTVLVNDSAANDEVARAYDLAEFCKIWLERSAVGYVLFPPL